MMGVHLAWVVAALLAVALGFTLRSAARRVAETAAQGEARARAAEQALADAEARLREAGLALERERDEARTRAAELDRARALLADALNQLPVPVWRRSPELRISDCNPAFARAVDATMEEAIRDGRMLGGPQVAQRALDLAHAAATALKPQRTELHVVVGGERRLLEISEAPLGEGGTIGIAIDVTAREDL